MTEEWRLVVGWEHLYEVSSFGNIRRIGKRGNLRGSVNAWGYPIICLSNSGFERIRPRHLLVAAAFIGPCPKGFQANHKDGNKSNPRLSNLEYVTQPQNMQHANRMGLRPVGEQIKVSRLKEEDVRRLRVLHSQGLGYKRLARLFPVSAHTAREVVLRHTWKHVE